MAWRYINPGYTALTNPSSGATEIADTSKTSTGVGYFCTSSTYGITLPNVDSSTSDLWVKFSAFIPKDSNYGFSVYVLFPGTTSGFHFYTNNGRYYAAYSRNYSNANIQSYASPEEIGINLNAVNNIWIHYSYGNLLEAKINSFSYGCNSSIVSYSASSYPNELLIFSARANVVFSGVIISNEEISPKEQVVALPISTTETAMSFQSDTYFADSAGQTILQSVDVSQLISEFGSDSKVTGLALVGNPAYRTGEQLSSLTAISKSGGVITEHGTSNLSTDSDSVIVQGFSVDKTLADLQNLQLGWKAGE